MRRVWPSCRLRYTWQVRKNGLDSPGEVIINKIKSDIVLVRIWKGMAILNVLNSSNMIHNQCCHVNGQKTEEKWAWHSGAALSMLHCGGVFTCGRNMNLRSLIDGTRGGGRPCTIWLCNSTLNRDKSDIS